MHILDFKEQFTSDDNLKKAILEVIKTDPSIRVKDQIDVKDLDSIVNTALEVYFRRVKLAPNYAKKTHFSAILHKTFNEALADY
jgi:hypothetical protein